MAVRYGEVRIENAFTHGIVYMVKSRSILLMVDTWGQLMQWTES